MKKKRAKTAKRTARKAAFSLPCFTAEVAATLETIQAKMPYWYWNFDCFVMIRAMVGEDHHPALWTLAALMLDYDQQRLGGRRKTFADIYPMTEKDIRACRGHHTMTPEMKEGASPLNPVHWTLHAEDHLALWGRNRENLLSDINGLLAAAASVGDAFFFERWGAVCQAVARYSFGAKPITGKREWQDGVWVSETRWEDDWQAPAPRPQPKRNLVIEIVKARQRLYFELHRLPTNPELAEFILEQQAEAGRLPKNQNPKTFVKNIATTIRREGLSTCVIERKKKSGDNKA